MTKFQENRLLELTERLIGLAIDELTCYEPGVIIDLRNLIEEIKNPTPEQAETNRYSCPSCGTAYKRLGDDVPTRTIKTYIVGCPNGCSYITGEIPNG